METNPPTFDAHRAKAALLEARGAANAVLATWSATLFPRGTFGEPAETCRGRCHGW